MMKEYEIDEIQTICVAEIKRKKKWRKKTQKTKKNNNNNLGCSIPGKNTPKKRKQKLWGKKPQCRFYVLVFSERIFMIAVFPFTFIVLLMFSLWLLSRLYDKPTDQKKTKK